MDVSQEKLESMLEAEAMNFSSLCQDLTHTNSPFYMETSSTTSDLPQVCIAYKFQDVQIYSAFTLFSIWNFPQKYEEE